MSERDGKIDTSAEMNLWKIRAAAIDAPSLDKTERTLSNAHGVPVNRETVWIVLIIRKFCHGAP